MVGSPAVSSEGRASLAEITMNWFHRLCRNTGLMLHNVRHPDGPTAKERHVVREEVEEKKVSPTVTLRRTTIEEIEVSGDSSNGDDGNDR